MASDSFLDLPIDKSRWGLSINMDWPLLTVVLALCGLGLVMVASASIATADMRLHNAFFYFQRQAVFLIIGLIAATVVLLIPLSFWNQFGSYLLIAALFVLVLVFTPLGKTVNGSTRWLDFGVIRVQVSEIARLIMVLYAASYLVRYQDEVQQSYRGFLKLVGVMSIAVFLLLLEPDLGSSAVLVATVFGMLFLAGARLLPFIATSFVVLIGFVLLVWLEPYRMRRVTGFLNPWQDPLDSGYQLANSLIAFGGGWSGTGLGGSIQKLAYLPEAHTDFIFAIMAEELGLFGVAVVVAGFSFIVMRAFNIGARAEQGGHYYAAYIAYGFGIWLGAQAFINMGVNMGVLPTKGITLPFMSYGGSSLVIMLMVAAFILRANHEVSQPAAKRAAPKAKRGSNKQADLGLSSEASV